MTNVTEWVNGWTIGGKLSLLLFALFIIAIYFTATRMVKYSEVLISKSKFGGAFIGGGLIAIFASMPELITEVVQSLNGEPGVGLADDLGANAVSALAIGIAILVLIKHSFTKKMNNFTKISIFVNSLLGMLLGIFIYFGKDIPVGTKDTFIIGIIPIFMFLIYLLSLWVSYKFNDGAEEVDEESIKGISLKKGVWMFLLFGSLVFISALGLNISVDSIQDGYAIPSTSAGGIFLSMTTSLPEIVSFVALVKTGQYTAGVLAIVGSQTFNVGVSIFGDMAYTEGAFFEAKDVQKDWLLGIMFGLEMGLLGLHVLLESKMKQVWMKGIFPILMILTYLIGWILILTII